MDLNFSSARTCTDRLVGTQWILMSMEVPLDGATWMLGDNESVVTLSTIPHSVLNKRHNFLSYHRVRCAVAHKVMFYC